MRRALSIYLVVLVAGCAPIHVPSTPRAATHRVLCYGDSITSGMLDESWPMRLASSRPDLEIINAGKIGDTSNSAPRFADWLARGSYEWVVILIGVNDPMAGTVDSTITVRNIGRLVGLARARGASVLVLTLLPVTRPRGETEPFDLQTFTRDVSRGLVSVYAGSRRGVVLGDLRGAMTGPDLNGLSDDGLHPNAAGNAFIAAFVAGLLPPARSSP